MPDPIKLITLQEPSSAVSEAYRTLRMNLQYATLDRSLRTLLVTSPGPDEGKSTTLSNLAVTMAQVERRVIIVDCDLRRPRLHEIFGLDNKIGFTTMMLDDDMLQHPPLLNTGVDNLRLLPSGQLPPRPADLLGSSLIAPGILAAVGFHPPFDHRRLSISTQSCAHFAIASNAALSARPFFVSAYSTLTGVSGTTVRSTMPSCSSSCSRSLNMRSVMSGMASRKVAKRQRDRRST